MIKCLCVVLAAVALITLVGCPDKEPSGNANAPGATKPATTAAPQAQPANPAAPAASAKAPSGGW